MVKLGAFNDKIEEALAVLKKELLVPYYRKGNVAELASGFEEKGFVDTLNVNCPDFSLNFDLKTDENDAHVTDYDNVVTLYSALKDLPPVVAANPQFWAWEAHADFSDYIHNRSESERSRYTEVDVCRDFFCRIDTGGVRRALVVNPLSRLWWTGRLLHDDENLDNPYHFVRYFTSSAFNSKILLLASSTAASNHKVAMGMMDAIDRFKLDRSLADITRREILTCTKYLNSIGAVRMIDTLSREEIRDICLKRMDTVL